jgi:hypothetical protein
LSEFQIKGAPISTGKEMSDEQQGRKIRAGFNCFVVAAYDWYGERSSEQAQHA